MNIIINNIFYTLTTGTHQYRCFWKWVTFGMEVCGTIKSNRAGLPENDLMKGNEPRGTMNGYQGCFGTKKAKNMYYTQWMDSKLVNVLSSFPTKQDVCLRRTKATEEKNTSIVLSCLSIIGEYNKGIGGTDAIDQELSYYRPKLRYRKWPKKTNFSSYLVKHGQFSYKLQRK